MEGLFVVLLMLFVKFSPSLCTARLMAPDPSPSSFNVVSYGAKGDGSTDDSQAFAKAWEGACGVAKGTPTLVIPKGKTFLLQPLSFKGPCKAASIKIELQGTITAPKSEGDWKWGNSDDKRAWVLFSGISGLVIQGGGKLDGQGAPWWKVAQNNRPTALKFNNCDNLRLSTLTHMNSPWNHIGINSCKRSLISNLRIIAPEDSPNTDGIKIASSSNVRIKDSTIQTGDDCIAIITGSSLINITGIQCGPGHGISIGSLGKGGSYDEVEGVHVQNCSFHATTNGVRIKTWKGGKGYARKITFEDIEFKGTQNPVIIDQQYDALQSIGNNNNNNNAVKVSDITYRNIRGTSSTENAILLNCDASVGGCSDIVLDDIDIKSEDGNQARVICNNAHGTSSSCNPKVPCLS